MAGTAKPFTQLAMKLFNKEVDWDTDVIKVMLCTSSFTPNQATMDYKDHITNEVANGNGYTTGGQTLAGKTIVSDGTRTVILDANDNVWTNSTITARYAVLYDDSPATDATKPLIGYVDFGEDVVSNAGNFTVTWAATGIMTLVANT